MQRGYRACGKAKRACAQLVLLFGGEKTFRVWEMRRPSLNDHTRGDANDATSASNLLSKNETTMTL